MKKVLVLGSQGMLGHIVALYLKETKKYKVITHSRNHNTKSTIHIDLTASRQLEQYLFQEKPDVVINCVGVLIKGSKTDPTNAIYLNAYFPHLLSDIIKFHGGKLIHISTDCVFSGLKGNYSEQDTPDASDTYGRSKALGELINDYDLTLRTSIVGPELKENGEGLFHWFMKSKGKVNGYTNVIWGGVTTLALAKVIEQGMDENIVGLQHVTNGVPISKYDLLDYFKYVWDKTDIDIIPDGKEKKDSSLITKRMAPLYFGFSYLQMLEDLRYWMQQHSELYK
jgi:dTDP-4-dehydrorhamnose reductase